ncbi:MAG: PEGA domain-containing protein, partial [Marinobacter sp.]
MVDFRPLMFINALALMLLVTAGFASVQHVPVLKSSGEPSSAMQQQTLASLPAPAAAPKERAAQPLSSAALPEETNDAIYAEQPTSVTPSSEHSITAEAFEVEPIPDDLQTVAFAEPFTPPPIKPEPATTGKLVLRSNVVGDQVRINGKNYGATR